MLEMKHIVAAAPAVVFAAFTDPNQLAKWWGPEGFTIPGLKFQARIGESYRIEMQPPAGDPFHLTGEFREVNPPARLAYTFVWEPADPEDVETLVSLSFRDLGDSTEVVLTQGPFETGARHALHRDGWRDSFDKLERLVAEHA
jgi:uncharacterized protein YndB with AHSA1/START domain